ncbi:MAG: DUF2326 domain-containing protein [Bacilli bacterium]|nr:DUF2326 domain-containing protein [Bacilli bacterium]
MYLKSLQISCPNEVIRDIKFHNGLNLIVDNTPSKSNKIKTGNNVGKTTVLKLVDVCFGANPKIVYQDTEDKNKEYVTVRNYLQENNVSVLLQLVDSFENPVTSISIARNFLQRTKAIRMINGEQVLDKDFETTLLNLFFPEVVYNKPTFRQIISHNNRYTDDKIQYTLRTLDKYTKDTEYETLNLFLLGCDVSNGEQRQLLVEKIKQEESYKNRVENGMSLPTYKSALEQILLNIEALNREKDDFCINVDFEKDLNLLDEVRYKINSVSSEISTLNIRRELIEESVAGFQSEVSNIDTKELKILYEEVKANISELHKTFEELVSYHNKMIQEKIKFISSELPTLKSNIVAKQSELSDLLRQESEYASKIAKYDSFETLENIIEELNNAHRQQGEYETIIKQLSKIDDNLSAYNTELKTISDDLFSVDFKTDLDARIERFNKYFSAVSKELYGENYFLSVDVHESKGKKFYKFSAYNMNLSSGKKQGEILCFDIAYILYARQENIPHLDFLLNDKKELLHDNQLEKVADFVKKNNIQLVLTILKDKLPASLVKEEDIILELSQDDKLFRIESGE